MEKNLQAIIVQNQLATNQLENNMETGDKQGLSGLGLSLLRCWRSQREMRWKLGLSRLKGMGVLRYRCLWLFLHVRLRHNTED